MYQTPLEREQAIRKDITDLKSKMKILKHNVEQLKAEIGKGNEEKSNLESKGKDVESELEKIRQNRNELKVRVYEFFTLDR